MNLFLFRYVFRKTDQSSKVKKFLVLDQFLSDTEYDLKKYSNYISNLKTIMVYRDPRDVYMTAKNLNIPWIPVIRFICL